MPTEGGGLVLTYPAHNWHLSKAYKYKVRKDPVHTMHITSMLSAATDFGSQNSLAAVNGAILVALYSH